MKGWKKRKKGGREREGDAAFRLEFCHECKESRVISPDVISVYVLSLEEARNGVQDTSKCRLRFSFISRCIRAFPDDRSPTAYSTRFRIVVCGRSTSPKKTFSSRGERLAPPYAPPVPLHALQVVPVWWIRVSPSSFFVLLYACRIHGRGKDTGVRGWVHTWVYVCQM